MSGKIYDIAIRLVFFAVAAVLIIWASIMAQQGVKKYSRERSLFENSEPTNYQVLKKSREILSYHTRSKKPRFGYVYTLRFEHPAGVLHNVSHSTYDENLPESDKLLYFDKTNTQNWSFTEPESPKLFNEAVIGACTLFVMGIAFAIVQIIFNRSPRTE